MPTRLIFFLMIYVMCIGSGIDVGDATLGIIVVLALMFIYWGHIVTSNVGMGGKNMDTCKIIFVVEKVKVSWLHTTFRYFRHSLSCMHSRNQQTWKFSFVAYDRCLECSRIDVSIRWSKTIEEFKFYLAQLYSANFQQRLVEFDSKFAKRVRVLSSKSNPMKESQVVIFCESIGWNSFIKEGSNNGSRVKVESRKSMDYIGFFRYFEVTVILLSCETCCIFLLREEPSIL